MEYKIKSILTYNNVGLDGEIIGKITKVTFSDGYDVELNGEIEKVKAAEAAKEIRFEQEIESVDYGEF